MTVENFVWDSQNQSVSWIYNGKVIKETFENAYFASVDLQKNYVYVEAGQNYSRDQFYNLSFEGKRIFIFDKVSGKISWIHQNQLVEIHCKNTLNAQIYIEQNVIIIITGPNQTAINIKGFTLDGRLVFEKEPPKGYKYMYLSNYKNQPSIVCDGGENNVDDYGRSRWHFVINVNTGDMTKENLAY
ncbi:hypothetical protein [Vallitalea guaymasensis]|uniref:hypothetical protein n=1 Tax=Vallitalea guaymasensis TaxID=1185412 RepID=UPI000DE1E936|nr:hypothetical protein [Vallitalea guaymasensis]